MSRITLIVLLLVAVLLPGFAQAATTDKDRPKIGLVLSGGGARGAAHIGVLRKLEELKVPVDYIAGTSMGAIVGGLYASGLSPDEIENVLISIDWLGIFRDKTERKDRTFRRKLDDKLYVMKAKAGLSDEAELKLPGGLLHGQKIDLVLNKHVLHISHVHDFDKLPIPYRAVAADITTGDPVVLGKGELSRAMRASMNIPAAFAPVEINDRQLIDGGIANNLPIDVVREMGAEIVIAVDISTPLYTREELSNILKITTQLTGFLTRKNTVEQLKTLTSRDVLIVPDLGDIAVADFTRTKETVPIGEKAANAKTAELQRLSLPAEQYATYLASRDHRQAKIPAVAFIRLDNQSRVSDEVITSRVTLQTGQPLNTAQLEADIGKIYGLELFENVSYEIVEENNQTGVVIHARERSWGPNYLQFGIAISDNLEGDNSINLAAAYTRTAINRLNGEWRTGLQLGEEPGLLTELYQPLDYAGRFFFNVGAFAGQRNLNIYSSVGDQIAEYRLDRIGAALSGGMNFGTWGELRLGYRRTSGDAEVRIGTPPLGDFNFDSGYAYTRFSIDTIDNAYFPNKGQAGTLEAKLHRDSLGDDNDFEQVSFKYIAAKTWGRNTFLAGVRFDTTLDDDAPIYALFRAGGFTNLSGFNQNELSGQHAGIAKLHYLRRINDFRLLPVYLGASLEYGGVWQDSDDIFDNNTTAASVFLGLDTPIGPIYTGYGHAEGGHDSLYVFMGKLF